MALYGISQEGSASMLNLANELLSASTGLSAANNALKRTISANMSELGVYGTEIWAIALQLDDRLKDRAEAIQYLAGQAQQKSDEILELLGLSGGAAGGAGETAGTDREQGAGYHRTNATISEVSGWIKSVNPNYHNPFLPPGLNPYHVNCGSCAFAVESRLSGTDASASATAKNIGTDAEMEAVTGKKCVYMSPRSIEQKLIGIGAGAHLIVGINRHPTPMGTPQSGHWFNVFYDGQKIYTIDGQSGSVYDWPHDYTDVSEWCALV